MECDKCGCDVFVCEGCQAGPLRDRIADLDKDGKWKTGRIEELCHQVAELELFDKEAEQKIDELTQQVKDAYESGRLMCDCKQEIDRLTEDKKKLTENWEKDDKEIQSLHDEIDRLKKHHIECCCAVCVSKAKGE